MLMKIVFTISHVLLGLNECFCSTWRLELLSTWLLTSSPSLFIIFTKKFRKETALWVEKRKDAPGMVQADIHSWNEIVRASAAH